MKLISYIVILILLCSGLNAQARVIRVGADRQIRSIQLAIHLSKNGDSVFVEPGIYAEKNIVIDRSITLLGIGYPILDGEGKYEVISVKANRVIVRGFKIIHSGISSLVDIAGLKVYSCNQVSIQDNILEGTFFGIYLQGANNCRIENNKLTGHGASDQQSGNGIHCWKCDSLCIVGNIITGHRDGIYFEFVTNSVIWRNQSRANSRYGLHFMFSHQDAYIANIFQNNSAGVSVMFTHGVKMFNNLFEDNWGDGAYGIFIKEIADSYIIGNKFLANTTGIFMEGASRIQMEKNVFYNNGWALKIQASCMDIVITHNNFKSNTFDIGTNGSLVLNSFNNNYWDKYDGYDLDKDNRGDLPYHPVSLFSMVVEKNPPAMILFRSFMTSLMDKSEKVIPSLTPEGLKDGHPFMKPLPL